MVKYVAFLRGINVGGRTIKMAELKACFEKDGFKNVATLLQTGNVSFERTEKDASKLKTKIEKMLTTRFNYPAKVQVLSLDDLSKIIKASPFGQKEGAHSYVIFLENGLEKALLKEEYNLASGEEVSLGRGVLYWRVSKGSTLKSSFSKLLSKSKYKDFNTNRNLNTLKKLID